MKAFVYRDNLARKGVLLKIRAITPACFERTALSHTLQPGKVLL